MNFLEKIDYMMQKLDLNKNKLSQLSGVPYTTIDAFYKKGYENTKMSTIRKIANTLNVSLDYLIVDSIEDSDYGKVFGFGVSTLEVKHIKKYRTLDEYGKKMIDTVLDLEHDRCTAPSGIGLVARGGATVKPTREASQAELDHFVEDTEAVADKNNERF